MRKLLSFILALFLIFTPISSFAVKVGTMESPTAIEGMWTVVKDSGELASAVTSYTFSGLNGDVDGEYHLIVRIISGASSNGVYLLPNNDSTSGHFGTQVMGGYGTDKAAIRYATLGGWLLYGQYSLTNNYVHFADVHIQAKSGFVRTCTVFDANNITGTTVAAVSMQAQSWTNTADNLTSLVVSASQASGIGIGSRFILLKKCHNTGIRTGEITPNSIKGTWERVCDYTVSGAAISSYQVTGIAGNTYPIYRVRVRGVDKDTVGAWYLRMNNVSTAGIYGYQLLYGTDTTAGAERATYPAFFIGATADDSALTMSDTLLYIKSGFVRTGLSSISTNISTTTVTAQYLFGSVFNNTADEITTFDFVPQADKFNIGTNIVVERLVL